MHAERFLIPSKHISQRFEVDRWCVTRGRALFRRNEDLSPEASIHVTLTLVYFKMLLGTFVITGPIHSWIEK